MENETSEMIVKRVSVPIGLEELMEGLSKEVLLKKPDDLYEFAARYFSKLLLLRDKTNYKVKTVRSAQTVTEQNRRLTRVPYGTVPKALSRQFSIRDHSATRRNQVRQPCTESPRRQIHPQTDSLASKRDSSKTNKNEVTQQSSTKKTEAATEPLEPSVNKVALSSRRPRRRYDSKRSSSHDKNETQSKGTKISNASASESADTIERTEMIPKRRESNSSTLSNVPSIESSEAKFNTDSPAKAPKDAVKDGSTLSTPRDKSSTDKAKISKRVSASDSSVKDKVEEPCGTKSLRDGKVMKKSTSKVSPRSDTSKCDTQRSTGSEGRNLKAISPSKDKSKAKLLKEQGVMDKSSKNYGTPSASRYTDDQSNIATAGLANASTADHSTDKVPSKDVSLNSGSLNDSIGNKVIAEHSATQDISEPVVSISGASKNGATNNLSQTGEVDGNAKNEKDSSKHPTSVNKSQKDIKKDGIMNSDSAGKSRIEDRALKATSPKSESEDKLQKKRSSNEERDRSSSIPNQDISKAAESISEASGDGTKNDISGEAEDNAKNEKDPPKHMTPADKSQKDINKEDVMKSDSGKSRIDDRALEDTSHESDAKDKLQKAPPSNEERDRSSSIHNQDASKAAESISETSKDGTKNDLSQILGEFERTAKNEKDSSKTSADGSQKSLEKDGTSNPDSKNLDALKSTSHKSKTEDKLQTKPSSNEKRDHSNGIHNQDISEATESISETSKNGAKDDVSNISGEVDSNAKNVKDSSKHMFPADESQKDLEKDGSVNSDSARKSRTEDRALEGISESEKMIQKNPSSNEERDQSSSIHNQPDISCASDQHLQQSSPKNSGRSSESSSLKLTEHCSKVSTAREDGTKCSQIGQKKLSESASYAAAEEKIQDNSTSISRTLSEKVPTDSKVTENQSLVDSISPKISQNKVNTVDDTKMSSKEETRSISSSEEDKKGKCVSTQDSSIHISSDSKKSPKEMEYNNIGKSSLGRKSPAKKPSSEENHERGTTSDLEGRECVAQSSTLEHQPPFEGSSKTDPQRKKSSTTSSSENQSPQNYLIERKAEGKDTDLSHASLNSTNMDRSSSADKAAPIDESSKIVEQDIVRNCSGTSKDTSKSDETKNVKEKDGAKEKTNTHNIPNDSDTMMQPRTIDKNQIKGGDDLNILDVKSETSRVSDEKLRHSRSVKSPKSSSEDKLKSANGSEKKKTIKESNQVELSIESDKNTSIHSATSSSQANNLEEQGDSNSTGLSQESEQASTTGKQVASMKQEVTENKVTNSTESSKTISASNDKDRSVGSEQLFGNIYPVKSLDAVEKEPPSNSEKTVGSMNTGDPSLILQRENDDIEKSSKEDVISSIPSNTEVSTTEAITIGNYSNKDDQSNKDDLQRKSTSGNSETELNVNLTNEEAKSLSSHSEQHKNIESTKTTTHSTDEVNVSDNLTTHTSEGDSGRSPGVTKIQDVSDPKQALLTNTKAELNDHKIKHNAEENSDSSRNEKSSSMVGSTDAKHIASGSQETSALEVDTSRRHADLKEFKTGAENTDVGENMAISLVGREMLGKSTNLKSVDASVVDGKSVSENSEIKIELPQTTEHDSKSPSSSTSSGKTKTTDGEPRFTGLSNKEVGHGATGKVISDSSQPKSIFDTKIDRDLDKTDKIEEHAPKEQNTNTNSNKPVVNKGKVVILNAEIANNLPNTSGENEKTDDNTSATVQGNQSDKAKNDITELQAPIVSEISIGKEIAELNQHTSSQSLVKTGTTVSFDENRRVSDKVASVNGNSTECTQAASTIKGYETKGAGLADENSSNSINVEVKGRQKIETETSAISSDSAANVMDKDVDSAAKNSETDHPKGSTVPHEISSTTSSNVKSDDKKQESSTEVNQARMLKDAKKKSVDETKSAGQEKIKKSLQNSLSLETGSSPSNSGRLASSSLKSGSKESSRLVNDLSANPYPKRSAISSRDNGNRVSTSKSKEPSEISKNRQVSPKKLTFPENQQPNPKDSTAKPMSNSTSSSSAGSSKLSSNKEQSVDSGNNSLTTSSSEKEVSKDRCDVTETQTNENQKPSSSHKRALQRSSKVVESSSESLSTSRGSGGGNEAKPTAPSEKSDSTEKRDKTGENKSPRSNVSEEKYPVLENSTKDKKAVPSLSIDKEINDKAQASLDAEPVNITKNIPLDTVPKKMSPEDDNGTSDNSEKVSSSKASKIPIKINHKDDQRANISAKANSGVLDTNSLSVKNVEPEKDEVQKMKQELEEANTHNMDLGKKNDVDGISDEDRLILEKLNIDVTKDNSTSFSKQDVDQTCGTKDVGVDGVDLHHITTDAGGVQTIDSKEQKSENHMTVVTNKSAEDGQTGSQIESIVGGDDVSKVALDKLHSEHTKDASKSSEAETSIVGDGMQNHSVSKRATEEYASEKSSTNKSVGQTEKPNVIQQTLQHKNELHPDVKGFINQFVQNEQANVYKEHCLCREVRLHDDEKTPEMSSEEQNQAVDEYNAESGKIEDRANTSSTSTEQDAVIKNQSKQGEGGGQTKIDLIGLTLKHKDGLHPDVKGFLGNFIEKEQKNVYKEHCSCKEVSLHDTTDDSGVNDKEHMSPDADEHNTTIQEQRSEEIATHIDDKIIKRGYSVDSARPNGYLNYKVPTAEVKGIQALTVQDQNGKFINKSNESNEGSSRFDIAKLREELERVQDESKMNTFHNSYNPYKLRQELKQYSSTASDKNNNTHKTFSAANAVLKIQSMWRGFLVRKVLKRDETVEKSDSPVKANGVLKSGTGEKSHASTTIIANGGHKIPKDTNIIDSPIEVSFKEQKVIGNKDSTTSGRINNKLEASMTSQVSDSVPGLLKTEPEYRNDQDSQSHKTVAANGGQKIPKDEHVIGTVNGVETNSAEAKIKNLELQAPSEVSNGGSNKSAEVATVTLGSKSSTTQEVEALAKHSQNTSHGVSESDSEHRSDQNVHSSGTSIDNKEHKIISKESHMTLDQSRDPSLKDVSNRESGSKSTELSSKDPSSAAVSNSGLDTSSDTTETKVSFDSHLKDPPKHDTEDPKGSHANTSTLKNQGSSERSSSGAANSEASNTEKEDAEELEKAATALQSMWRGFKARKGNDVESKKMGPQPVRRKRKTEDKDMRKVSSICKEDAAALKIQSLWKAYVARKGIDTFKSSLATINEKKPLHDGDAAATKIQAHVRGHLVRRKIGHEKRSAGDTEEYRPTSIDSTDSADTVIYRGLLSDDDYDSLHYDAALDHVAHMLKDEGSITDYQNKLLAQISGRSEDTSQKGEAETKSSKAFQHPEVLKVINIEEGDNTAKTVDKDATDIPAISKTIAVGAELKPVSTIHDVITPPKSNGGHEGIHDSKAMEHQADSARPQTRRGREQNEENLDRSVPGKAPVTSDSTITKELTKSKDFQEVLHENISLRSSTTGNVPDLTRISSKDQENAYSKNDEANELEVTAKQSYISTNEESNNFDGLRGTSEMHDIITIPQYMKEEHIEPDQGKTLALDATAHKSDVASNGQSSVKSSKAVTKNEIQVPPKTTEPQENEKPDNENSARSQQSSGGLEKMHLQHSSEFHDAILLPVAAGRGDSKTEVKDDSKGTNPDNNKSLESGNGESGLKHSSEYHDCIVLPLKPNNEETDLPQQAAAPKASKSEEGQKFKEPPNAENKELDGCSETDTSSPIGLRHSSELHDVLVLPYKEDDIVKDKHGGKHCDVSAETAKSAQTTLSPFVAAAKRSMETKPAVSIGESQNNDMRTPTEVQAATKIQAGFRGYKVRKQLKQKNESPEGDKPRRSSRPKNNNQVPKEIEEQSAVKIQAGIRGFLVRRRQKKQTDVIAQ